jgi:hypothetical protein
MLTATRRSIGRTWIACQHHRVRRIIYVSPLRSGLFFSLPPEHQTSSSMIELCTNPKSINHNCVLKNY